MQQIFLLFLKISFMCVVLAVPLFVMYVFSLYVRYDFDPNFLAIHACEGQGKTWDYTTVVCK